MPHISSGADLAGAAQVLSATDRSGLRIFIAGTGDASEETEAYDPLLVAKWSRPMGECVDASPLVLRVRMTDNSGMSPHLWG